jgi:phosphate-selective porin OprO/OprP
MFDGPSNSWFVRETGIMVGVPALSGHIFVGRTKEGFSMNKVMVGYAGWGLERQMGIDIIPILADGVKWLGYLPKQRILWNIGVFADWLSKEQSFSTYSLQGVARIGWLPVYSDADNNILHIAMNMRYGKIENGEIRVRSRPESFGAPYFVDTDLFAAHHSIHIGGEAYYRSGSWMFGAEYYAHKFSSPETNNPLFYGGEIMATWIITGEKRPYSTVTGIYGFVPVNKPVFKGGPGAWEVLLRLTNIDLNDGTLSGGKFWRFSPMINWYLSENVRLELAYGYGILDRFNQKGATHFFQSRIQLSL